MVLPPPAPSIFAAGSTSIRSPDLLRPIIHNSPPSLSGFRAALARHEYPVVRRHAVRRLATLCDHPWADEWAWRNVTNVEGWANFALQVMDEFTMLFPTVNST